MTTPIQRDSVPMDEGRVTTRPKAAPEAAGAAGQTSFTGGARELAALLAGLARASSEAAAVCEAAAATGDVRLRRLAAQHRRHARELDDPLASLAPRAENGPVGWRYLPEDPSRLARLDPGAVLDALARDVAVVEREYEKVLRFQPLPDEVRVVLGRQLGEVRAHIAWLTACSEAIVL